MTAKEYILFILEDRDVLSKEDHAICRSLMSTMPVAEVAELVDSRRLDWYLDKEATSLLYESSIRVKTREHNRKWSEYLTSMKERKNVKVSRECLRSGFDHYDWKAQRTILRYFLDNGLKTDRVWALQKIYDDYSLIADTSAKECKQWHELILSLWHKHHDSKAAWLIVKNFPLDVIQKNSDALITECGYQPVALRLGVNPDFEIELDRLSDIDKLYVSAKLQRPVSDEFAETLFYNSIRSVLSVDDLFLPDTITSLMSLQKVKLAVWCLGKLGKSDIIMRFYNDDRDFMHVIERKWGAEYDSSQFWCWTKRMLPSFFPQLSDLTIQPCYSQESDLEQMQQSNPALKNLVESLNCIVLD